MGNPGRTYAELVAVEYGLDPELYLSDPIFQGEATDLSPSLSVSTQYPNPSSPDPLDDALTVTLNPLIDLERAIAAAKAQDLKKLRMDTTQYNLTGNAVRDALNQSRGPSTRHVRLGDFVIQLIDPSKLPDAVRREILYSSDQYPTIPMSQLALTLRADRAGKAAACALGIQLRLDERRPNIVSLAGMVYRLSTAVSN